MWQRNGGYRTSRAFRSKTNFFFTDDDVLLHKVLSKGSALCMHKTQRHLEFGTRLSQIYKVWSDFYAVQFLSRVNVSLFMYLDSCWCKMYFWNNWQTTQLWFPKCIMMLKYKDGNQAKPAPVFLPNSFDLIPGFCQSWRTRLMVWKSVLRNLSVDLTNCLWF